MVRQAKCPLHEPGAILIAAHVADRGYFQYLANKQCGPVAKWFVIGVDQIGLESLCRP